MNGEFKPYNRSRYRLGEPEAIAARKAEHIRILRNISGLKTTELFSLACNVNANNRKRYQAAYGIPWHLRQRLLNVLVSRSNDSLWPSLEKFNRLKDTLPNREALKLQLRSEYSSNCHRAMEILSEFGDDSISKQIDSMLGCDDRSAQLVAIRCLTLRENESSRNRLREYVRSKTAPINSKVDAAKGLLRMGEMKYTIFLRRVARNDHSKVAYHAACGIQRYNKIETYRLFLRILSNASHPASPVTVLHVATNLMKQRQIGFEHKGLEISPLAENRNKEREITKR